LASDAAVFAAKVVSLQFSRLAGNGRAVQRKDDLEVTVKAIVFDAYGTLYDIQSVAAVTEEAYPGYGEIITQIWRLKQLEYTWLRTLMGRYKDFLEVTRESLIYTLNCLGLKPDQTVFERIMEKYYELDLYPDARQTLAGLKGCKLAILSNGSPDMLDRLVKNTGLDRILDGNVSIDSKNAFKPKVEVYDLIEEELGVSSGEVLFVSSNAFDACGAKNVGLKVAWIERVTPLSLAEELTVHDRVAPLTMFKALRMQMEEFGLEPDYRIRNLSELLTLVPKGV
jgi:2-haloacid dehalogenase